MGYKDILVHVDASAHGRARLQMAADLAARHGARLSALYVRERSIAQQRRLKSSELGLVPGGQAGTLRASIEGELDAQSGKLRAMLAELQRSCGIEAAWHGVEGHARAVVAQYARYADLTVVGHDSMEDANLPEEYSFAETVLFTTGRPVLIVPSGAGAAAGRRAPGRRVALAWNGSPACARTLSAALPLIECAEHTTVLIIDHEVPAHFERLPPLTVLDHLRRHTDQVDSCTLESTGAPVSDLLQDAALDHGADLLIAGAHGRPMLWEKLLGSVTHGLLAQTRLPLVMCG